MLVRGEGRYTDDLNLPGQAYAAIVRSRAMPMACIKGIDTAAARRRCRACSRSTPAPTCRRRLRHAQMRAAVQEPRRHADEEAAAPGARDRQGALRRRSGRLRDRRDARSQAKDAAEAVVARHRAAARGHAGERGGQARRAAALRRRARTTSRSTIITATPRRSKAAFAKAAHVTRLELRQQPRRRQRDGAARGDRRLRRGERALHLPRRLPGRVRAARPARRHPRRPAGQGARAHRQCRRLVRHEGAGLSRIRLPMLHAARLLGRPVKWTDERSTSFLSDSHGRDHEKVGRARARRRRPLPRGARSPATATWAPISARWRRCRRPLNAVKNMVSVYRTPLIEVVDQVRVHQHDAGHAPIAAPAGPRATTSWSG